MLTSVLTVAGVAASPSVSAADAASRLALLRSLSIDRYEAIAPSWRNPRAGDRDVVALGQRLFDDMRLSGSGTLACSSCHQPANRLQDGRPTARGRGPHFRNTPSLDGAARRPWLHRDGRFDSLWAQALSPLESANEMHATRTHVARTVLANDDLREAYLQAFASDAPQNAPDEVVARAQVAVNTYEGWPREAAPAGSQRAVRAWAALHDDTRAAINRVFVDVGIALAAFQTRLDYRPARFDRYVARLEAGDTSGANETLTARERAGFDVFTGSGRCIECHHGPAFTDHRFHAIGTGGGREQAVEALLTSEFNCRGAWTERGPNCGHLRNVRAREIPALHAHSLLTPPLRGVRHTAPYMHDGRFTTLREVIDHYRTPPLTRPHELGDGIGLTEAEVQALEAFLGTL